MFNILLLILKVFYGYGSLTTMLNNKIKNHNKNIKISNNLYQSLQQCQFELVNLIIEKYKLYLFLISGA